MGAIGLEAVRLVRPTIGESVVVIGLGLIGLITVQILNANGCRVLGIDLTDEKVALARKLGISTHNPNQGEDSLDAAVRFTNGRGADAVIITASTASNEPIAQAAKMCRKRGRIVLVGVTGLRLNRSDFYEKELSFQVSCSYGPGRYDPAYEQRGQDYPLGYVRWTAQRNFETVLSLMEKGRIITAPLISRRFDFDQATSAYKFLSRSSSAIGIMLSYPGKSVDELMNRRVSISANRSYAKNMPVIGWIGAGNYGSRILIPAFRAAGARLDTLVTTGGAENINRGRAANFAAISSDVVADVLQNSTINTVVVATRHDTHAQFVIDALAAGHHVFVEKPLALSLDQVDRIEAAWHTSVRTGDLRQLMVGFNRRFSSLVLIMKKLLAQVSLPATFIYTCNTGSVPPNHWTRDEAIGGGRIVGEACHFIDLIRYLAASRIVATQVISLGNTREFSRDDSTLIALRFDNGSVGIIQYLANGSKRFPKERLEVFAGGGVLCLKNFRTLRGYGWRGFSSKTLWRQDKGQQACAAAFLASIREGTPPPIPIEEIFEVARVTLEVAAKQRAI